MANRFTGRIFWLLNGIIENIPKRTAQNCQVLINPSGWFAHFSRPVFALNRLGVHFNIWDSVYQFVQLSFWWCVWCYLLHLLTFTSQVSSKFFEERQQSSSKKISLTFSFDSFEYIRCLSVYIFVPVRIAGYSKSRYRFWFDLSFDNHEIYGRIVKWRLFSQIQ